ncbi:Uncharacterised protein [Mycobacteroides abscessus subsp. bolletii]|nr:Uncharacterised protein [Mycobacteroides abscessus subsp. bolletii]
MYNRAQAEQLILHTSRELALPVVLEDLSHRVILYAEGHELPSQLLQGWEGKSRRWASDHSAVGLIANPVTVQDPENFEVSWSFIDIQGHGIHWGRLFVRGAVLDDTLTLHTMRHAAMALSSPAVFVRRTAFVSRLVVRPPLRRSASLTVCLWDHSTWASRRGRTASSRRSPRGAGTAAASRRPRPRRIRSGLPRSRDLLLRSCFAASRPRGLLRPRSLATRSPPRRAARIVAGRWGRLTRARPGLRAAASRPGP